MRPCKRQSSHAAQPDCACAGGQGLRTAYGVGEQAGSLLTNSVVELCFTSSVRFLQPGLLLKVGALDPDERRCRLLRPLKSMPETEMNCLGMCNDCMHTGDIVHSSRSGSSHSGGASAHGFVGHACVARRGEGPPRQGVAGAVEEGVGGNDGLAGKPRKSWQMRKRQERAAIKEGLAEWQARRPGSEPGLRWPTRGP